MAKSGARIKRGWTIEDAFLKPTRKIVYSNGQTNMDKVIELLL